MSDIDSDLGQESHSIDRVLPNCPTATSATANSTRKSLLKLIVEVEAALGVVRQTLVAATGDQASEREVLLISACESATPPNQRQLAHRAAISPAQTSELVEKLRKRGWLERLPDPKDRRRQCWQATPTGRRLLAEIDQQLQALGVDSLEALNREETDSALASGSDADSTCLLAELAVLRNDLESCLQNRPTIKSAA